MLIPEVEQSGFIGAMRRDDKDVVFFASKHCRNGIASDCIKSLSKDLVGAG